MPHGCKNKRDLLEDEEHLSYVALPFFGSGFHALRRKARELGVIVVAKPVSTIASVLCSRAKHHLPPSQTPNCVYCISCSCGHIYIGESARELATRLSEHKSGWRLAKATSAFGSHSHCQPGPDWDNVRILSTETHHRLRLLLESAFIRYRGLRETVIQSPNDRSLNRNAGALLSDRWLACLRP